MKFAAIRDFYNDRYTQVMRKRFYNKQLFLDKSYFEAASDLIRTRPTERALVLTTQSFKADKYKEAFAEVGINAAHVADLDPSRMDEFCHTFFSTPIDASNEDTKDMPQAIVCNLRQFKGIQLPELNNVIVLGWESLEEESDFALIANMCNTKESIKARNDDKYESTKRGQMSIILDAEGSDSCSRRISLMSASLMWYCAAPFRNDGMLAVSEDAESAIRAFRGSESGRNT